MKSYRERHQMNAQQEKKDDVKRDKYGFRILKARLDCAPAEFPSTSKTAIMSTNQLSKMVNSLFVSLMPEYEGSRIYLNGFEITTELFFTLRPKDTDFSNGMIKVLQLRADKVRKNDSTSVIRAYNDRNKIAQAYDMTPEGKDALSEFVPIVYRLGSEKDCNYNWNKCATEISESNRFNGVSQVYLKVKVDINRVLNKLFGRRTKDGESFSYQLSPIRPIQTFRDPITGNIFTKDWMFAIIQLDEKEFNEVLQSAGMSVTGDLGIIHAR